MPTCGLVSETLVVPTGLGDVQRPQHQQLCWVSGLVATRDLSGVFQTSAAYSKKTLLSRRLARLLPHPGSCVPQRLAATACVDMKFCHK